VNGASGASPLKNANGSDHRASSSARTGVGASRAGFERELHVLAFHYHWPLGDLMALTRPRRRRFLHLLSEQLGSRGER